MLWLLSCDVRVTDNELQSLQLRGSEMRRTVITNWKSFDKECHVSVLTALCSYWGASNEIMNELFVVQRPTVKVMDLGVTKFLKNFEW
jgi:hypothetical protein